MTFTGLIGAIVNFPLRGIIYVCVRLRIHPNVLTLAGVIINIIAARELGLGRFTSAGVRMVIANIFDYIDGKVAHELGAASEFGGFLDSVMDRFSDITLFIGLVYLYSKLGHPEYVVITALAMMFSVMTSYTRARAESLIEKCKVGFMERPERIVSFMLGAFTNRMAAVMWAILVLSAVTVFDRILHTWRELEAGRSLSRRNAEAADPSASPRPPHHPGTVTRVMTLPALILWRGLFWTYERATWQFDVMVVAMLSFMWLVPARWLGDPMATAGRGLIQWVMGWP
jgi:CDP-diacylglycerol--glycerol-3-phosphate 3-phosphatidyltransferase